MQRIDSLLVQGIVTTFDDDGKPLHEDALPVMKVFRAAHPDIWASLETEKAKLEAAAQAQADAPKKNRSKKLPS